MKRQLFNGRRARLSVTLFAVAVLFGVPAGFAVGQAVDEGGPEVPSTAHKSAAECPEADAAFTEAGYDYDYFIPDCPSPDQLQQDLALAKQDPAIVEQCESARARGTATDTCDRILEIAASQAQGEEAGK